MNGSEKVGWSMATEFLELKAYELQDRPEPQAGGDRRKAEFESAALIYARSVLQAELFRIDLLSVVGLGEGQ